MAVDRRSFLAGSGLGIAAIGLGGATLLLSPREALARGLPLRALTAPEARTLAALGEVLLPGAEAAGLVPYVDSQLATAQSECLLAVRYADLVPPYAALYRRWLQAVESASVAMHGEAFPALEAAAARDLAAGLRDGSLTGWEAPDALACYSALRSDAVDVVYGTPEGSARLGLPYQEHVAPPEDW